MTRRPHHRLTPSQKRLLAVIASFERPATLKQIQLRMRRTAGHRDPRR